MADINLSVGTDVFLLAVNGVEVESASLFEQKNPVSLSNGKNQILVQYSAEIKSSGGYEIESSDAHVLVFNVNDQNIFLSAPEINSLTDFRRFNSGKYWLLKESSGRVIKYLSQPLLKEGIQINRDYERELQEFNKLGGELSIKSDASIPVFEFTSDQINNNSGSINLPETLLQYWYLKADKETRSKFKSWASDK